MARAPNQDKRCQFHRGEPNQCKRLRQKNPDGSLARRCWQHRVNLMRTKTIRHSPSGGLVRTKRIYLSPSEARRFLSM